MHLCVSNRLTALLDKVFDVVEATTRLLVAVTLNGLRSDLIRFTVYFGDHLVLLVRGQLCFLVDIVWLSEFLRHEDEWISVDLDLFLETGDIDVLCSVGTLGRGAAPQGVLGVESLLFKRLL